MIYSILARDASAFNDMRVHMHAAASTVHHCPHSSDNMSNVPCVAH